MLLLIQIRLFILLMKLYFMWCKRVGSPGIGVAFQLVLGSAVGRLCLLVRVSQQIGPSVIYGLLRVL